MKKPSTKNSKLIDFELRLLLLRYGRQDVIKTLARLGDQTAEDIELQLRALEQDRKSGRPLKAKASLTEMAEFESRERPDIADALRTIAVNFDNRVFLPHLRDAQRFLERMGASHPKLVSRAEAGRALIHSLARLSREEILSLANRDMSPHVSDYSLLSRAIMGGTITKPDSQE